MTHFPSSSPLFPSLCLTANFSSSQTMLSTKKFTVTTKAEGPVIPCEPTPAGLLPLSELDALPWHCYHLRTLDVFPRGGFSAIRTIRDALGKALVHYYPVAGRLVWDSDRRNPTHVDCNGLGVWFVEAHSDFTLEDVNFLDHPCPISLDDLLPNLRSDDPIYHFQVTEFACGGFVVGIVLNHTMLDGIGTGQFINAVAELARGLEGPTVKPVWRREAITGPTYLPPKRPSTLPIHEDLLVSVVDISNSFISRVKKEHFLKTGEICSTFDVSVSAIWQCRTKAIKLASDVLVPLVMMANTRHLMSDVLPQEGGYYGNCYYFLRAMATSRFVMEATILELVGLVRAAKARLPADFAKWRSGKVTEDPYEIDIEYETLIASDWARLGFRNVDYGWGTPARIVTPMDPLRMPQCILGLPAARQDCLRVITRCVLKEHLAAFEYEVNKMELSGYQISQNKTSEYDK